MPLWYIMTWPRSIPILINILMSCRYRINLWVTFKDLKLFLESIRKALVIVIHKSNKGALGLGYAIVSWEARCTVVMNESKYLYSWIYVITGF